MKTIIKIFLTSYILSLIILGCQSEKKNNNIDIGQTDKNMQKDEKSNNEISAKTSNQISINDNIEKEISKGDSILIEAITSFKKLHARLQIGISRSSQLEELGNIQYLINELIPVEDSQEIRYELETALQIHKDMIKIQQYKDEMEIEYDTDMAYAFDLRHNGKIWSEFLRNRWLFDSLVVGGTDSVKANTELNLSITLQLLFDRAVFHVREASIKIE